MKESHVTGRYLCFLCCESEQSGGMEDLLCDKDYIDDIITELENNSELSYCRNIQVLDRLSGSYLCLEDIDNFHAKLKEKFGKCVDKLVEEDNGLKVSSSFSDNEEDYDGDFDCISSDSAVSDTIDYSNDPAWKSEVRRGKGFGIDEKYYENPKLPAEAVRSIVGSIWDGLDITDYYNPESSNYCSRFYIREKYNEKTEETLSKVVNEETLKNRQAYSDMQEFISLHAAKFPGYPGEKEMPGLISMGDRQYEEIPINYEEFTDKRLNPGRQMITCTGYLVLHLRGGEMHSTYISNVTKYLKGEIDKIEWEVIWKPAVNYFKEETGITIGQTLF